MEMLWKFVEEGYIVVCFIYQFCGLIYFKFDDLILFLSGVVVYVGFVVDYVLKYFVDLGYKCFEYINFVEYFVDLIFIDYSFLDNEIVVCKKVVDLVEVFVSKQKKIG